MKHEDLKKSYIKLQEKIEKHLSKICEILPIKSVKVKISIQKPYNMIMAYVGIKNRKEFVAVSHYIDKFPMRNFLKWMRGNVRRLKRDLV